jgi:D-tyrosyl-tRNA(Tyr) deacylase
VRVVLQRCIEASVSVDGHIVGSAGHGLLVLLGIGPEDTEKDVQWMCNKLSQLRIFEDDDGKMNLSILDVAGDVLVVSQFTLYGNCRKGRRPSFASAGHPSMAEPLVDRVCEVLQECGVQRVEKGRFGTDMKVSLINDGPVTLIVDSPHS